MWGPKGLGRGKDGFKSFFYEREMECGDRRGWGEGKMVLSHFSTEERNGVWGPKGLGRGKDGFKSFFYEREMECGDRRGWGEGKMVLSHFSTREKWSVGTEGVGERERWF